MVDLVCMNTGMVQIQKTSDSQSVQKSPCAALGERVVSRKVTGQLKSCDIMRGSESEYRSTVWLLKKQMPPVLASLRSTLYDKYSERRIVID